MSTSQVKFEYVKHGSAVLNICLIPFNGGVEYVAVIKVITEMLDCMSFSRLSVLNGVISLDG